MGEAERRDDANEGVEGNVTAVFEALERGDRDRCSCCKGRLGEVLREPVVAKALTESLANLLWASRSG